MNREEIACVAHDLRNSCHGLPICIGFGISTPDDVAKVSEFADGVVVGSAFERLIESGLEDGNIAGRVGEYAVRLKNAILQC